MKGQVDLISAPPLAVKLMKVCLFIELSSNHKGLMIFTDFHIKQINLKK